MTRTAQKAYYVLNFKLRPIDPKSIVGLYVSFVFYWISFGFYIHDFSAKCRKRLNCLSRYHSNVTREGRISEPDSQKRCWEALLHILTFSSFGHSFRKIKICLYEEGRWGRKKGRVSFWFGTFNGLSSSCQHRHTVRKTKNQLLSLGEPPPLQKETFFLGDFSLMWVGGVADSQTRSKPLKKKTKSPQKLPFLTQISPFVLPNLTKTLGWVDG